MSYLPKLSPPEYRKHSSLSKKKLKAIEHIVMDQIERRVELESFFPLLENGILKHFEIIDELPNEITDFEQIETVAEIVRDRWNLGLAPIPDLIDNLETHGIRVFMIGSEADAKFAGLAISVDLTPVIVVNANFPGDRQRFTLAHELGHLMLAGRVSEDLELEKACHRFAGAFLIPRASIMQEFGISRTGIELKELYLLKGEFGLSMQGILFRLFDLKIISDKYFKELMKTFSVQGWRNKEPGEQYPPEKAHVFEQLIFHALAEEYIGPSKAAELMNISVAAFQDLRVLGGGDVVAHQ